MCLHILCLQVFIVGSAKYNDIGLPFGYLKASTSLSSVNLFVMPYNYPQLVPLLGKFVSIVVLDSVGAQMGRSLYQVST